jgi:hypothetical protein
MTGPASRTDSMASTSPGGQAAEALARGACCSLAKLAAQRVAAPVTLATSPPAESNHGERDLTVAVSFDPRSCQFIATCDEGAQHHQVFGGPSLTLACSAANQALDTLAPLETFIRVCDDDAYRRTCPQYQQEVHFRRALERLAELAGADQDPALNPSPTRMGRDYD